MDPQQDYRNKELEKSEPEIRPNLGVIEGGGEGDGEPTGRLSVVPEQEDDDDDTSGAESALESIEGGGEQTPRKKGHLKAAPESASSLSEKEQHAKDGYGPSAADDMRERLGLGYTGDPKDQSRTGKWFKSNSKLKKRAAIATAAFGAGTAAAVIAFLLLLPLKITSMVNKLEERAGAATNAALENETQNLFKDYIKKYVISNLNTPSCRSTVDAGCVSVVTGDGPVAKLYKSWRKNRLTQKLATNQGLSFAKTGNTYLINTNGKTFNFGSQAEIDDVLNDSGTLRGTRQEISVAFRDAIAKETLWKRMYIRYRYAPILKEVGVRWCVNACKVTNVFSDKLADKKLAAKGYIYNRVLSPLSENYSFIFQCALLGGDGCNVSELNKAAAGDDTVESDATSTMQRRLVDLASKLGVEELGPLVEKANELGRNGLSKFIVQEMTTKLISLSPKYAAGAGATGAKAAEAVDPITWALIIAQLADTGRHLGSIIKYMTYATNLAAAEQLFSAYQSVSSETKSGNIDITQLGSFANALSTNLDTSDMSSIDAANTQLAGSGTTASDATQTPLYQSLMGTGTSNSGTTLAGLFGGTAYAATTAASTSVGYKCDDGNAVPSGKLVCPEEELGGGTTLAQFTETISSFYNKYLGFLNAVTGGASDAILKILNLINSGVSWIVGKGIEYSIPPAVQAACDAPIGPCADLKKQLSSLAEPLFSFFSDLFMNSPFQNLSGGRMFDMLAAGASGNFNTTAQENLGAPYVDDATAAGIQTAYLNEQQASFSSQPLFARIFNTDTPYSFVSRLALATPGSTTAAMGDVTARLQQSPLHLIGGAFSSLFTSHLAYAADTSSAAANPFGIPQSAYPSSTIPPHPEQFWTANCVSGPLGKWDENAPAGKQLDISDWLNAGHNALSDQQLATMQITDDSTANTVKIARSLGMNTVLDPSTGQTLFVNPNPCQLILSSVISAGGLSDTSLIPADAMNNPSAPGSSGSPTTGTGYVGADGFPGGSCVAYVKYILSRHMTGYKDGAYGDGKDVAANLGKIYGVTVNHTPAVHAVVSFPTSYADPTYGHVAIVAEVKSDGSIVVEEANWGTPNQYGTHTVSASTVPNLFYAHTEGSWH